MTKEKKFYGMRNDYMFHAVLQKNEDVLKHLLAALLNIERDSISSCTIVNPIELGKEPDDKDCILDIKLVVNQNRIINIELQIRKQSFWVRRSLLYWARAYDSLKSGDNYDKLVPTYHIGILDFTLFEDRPKFISEYRIIDVEDGYQYTDHLCIKVLELPQLDAMEGDLSVNPDLIKWARVFKADTLEELESLTIGEEVFQKMVFTLKQLSEDEKIRMQCEAREDYERTLSCEFSSGYRQGKAEQEQVTERERQRADQAEQRAEEAEAEVIRLKALLSENGI